MGYSYLVVKNGGSGIEPLLKVSYRGWQGMNETPRLVALSKKGNGITAVWREQKPCNNVRG
jgi:hypothetical protein